MKEYFDNAEYLHYTLVQQQALFFIVGFQLFTETRSFLKTPLALIVFTWYAGGFYNLHTVFCGFIGMALSVLTAWTLPQPLTKKSISTHVLVYYGLVQPFLLYVVMRLYIDQTEFPLGVFVGFLMWMGGNGIVWIGEDDAQRWTSTLTTVETLAPLLLMFLFTAVLSTHKWLATIIVTSVQVFLIAVNIFLRFVVGSLRREQHV